MVGKGNEDSPSAVLLVLIIISGSTYLALFEMKKRFLPTRETLAEEKNVLEIRFFGRSYPKTISLIRMFEALLIKASPMGLFLPPTLFQKDSAVHVFVLTAPSMVTPTSSVKI